MTGLVVAAAYLTKLSNLPLIAVALVAVFVKLRADCAANAAFWVGARWVRSIICAAIPIGSWMVWTKYHFGDLTGSTAKITLLGWTRKPFGDWWQHPILRCVVFWMFWSNLMASFWRGEVSWHGRPMSWGPSG